MTNYEIDEKGYGIKIEEYKGRYALAQTKKYKDQSSLCWAYSQVWDKAKGCSTPAEKATPIKINLGDTLQQAISVLELILTELKDGAGQSKKSDSGMDDIPF